MALNVSKYMLMGSMLKLNVFVATLLLSINLSAFAIELPLKNIDGSDQNLNDFKGNWVVVNFWATWCPPCIAEMPDLQAFHDKYAGKGAMVVGVNTENLASDQLQFFLDSYFITYPIYHGAQLMNSALGTVPGLPTTFLVSPQGNVEARQVGTVTAEMIENFIEKWEAKRLAQ